MSHHVIGADPNTAGSGDAFRVINPADGSVVSEYALATEADVDAAVDAARAAYKEWSRATPKERSDALARLATIVDNQQRVFAEAEVVQTGKPIRLATEFDVPGTVDNIAFFAGAARNLEGRAAGEYSGDHTSFVRREPIGVIGSISPWNYPLQMAAWKILPAVAAGNTIVLKPAEITPITSAMLARAALDAGIPAGVINVVAGLGPVAGAHLVRSAGVDMVSFTGSTAVGSQVGAAAAGAVKRVHLELGGKAPFVVFADADLEAAAHGAVAAALINSGQDCTAATRAYVHRTQYAAFVERVAALMNHVRLGDPMDPATDLGPLVTHAHRDRVKGFVDRAVEAGAKVVTGGNAPDIEGAYYQPTLIIEAAQDSEIVQREVFGPVLAVLPFDTEDEAIALANDTPYGLAASVWTKDVHRALRGSREIQAGCVWINDHIPIISEMPHGGFRRSGFGKDMSTYSFEEYTQVKHVMADLAGLAEKAWHRTIFREP
jgi:betaine-aldehyde dehydrogenase